MLLQVNLRALNADLKTACSKNLPASPTLSRVARNPPHIITCAVCGHMSCAAVTGKLNTVHKTSTTANVPLAQGKTSPGPMAETVGQRVSHKKWLTRLIRMTRLRHPFGWRGRAGRALGNCSGPSRLSLACHCGARHGLAPP